MKRDELQRLLEQVQAGQVGVAEALDRLAALPATAELPDATLDLHRELRTGFPEVVFCQGKTPAACARIVARLAEAHGRVIATRATPEQYAAVRAAVPDAAYHEVARFISVQRQPPVPLRGRVAVVCAGTADVPVAEEAALTAEAMGAPVDRVYDVGVAGLHRLLARLDNLRRADVLVVVAGMEAALASVVGGLVAAPVIAVPTSVGYGAHFGGLAALLSMLNSCAAGVLVVNIDNGFGAGYAAANICRLKGA